MDTLSLFRNSLVPLGQLLEVSSRETRPLFCANDRSLYGSFNQMVEAKDALNLLAVFLGCGTTPEFRVTVEQSLQGCLSRAAIRLVRAHSTKRAPKPLTLVGSLPFLQELTLDIVRTVHALVGYTPKERHVWMGKHTANNPLVYKGRINFWRSLVKRSRMEELDIRLGHPLGRVTPLVYTLKGSPPAHRVEEILAILRNLDTVEHAPAAQASEAPEVPDAHIACDFSKKLPPEVTVKSQGGQLFVSVWAHLQADEAHMRVISTAVKTPRAQELFDQAAKLHVFNASELVDWRHLGTALAKLIPQLDQYMRQREQFKRDLADFCVLDEVRRTASKLRKKYSEQELRVLMQELSGATPDA